MTSCLMEDGIEKSLSRTPDVPLQLTREAIIGEDVSLSSIRHFLLFATQRYLCPSVSFSKERRQQPVHVGVLIETIFKNEK